MWRLPNLVRAWAPTGISLWRPKSLPGRRECTGVRSGEQAGNREESPSLHSPTDLADTARFVYAANRSRIVLRTAVSKLVVPNKCLTRSSSSRPCHHQQPFPATKMPGSAISNPQTEPQSTRAYYFGSSGRQHGDLRVELDATRGSRVTID